MPWQNAAMQLAIGFALCGDAIRLGPLVVRPLDLTQHVRRKSRREKCTCPAHGGSAASVGIEEGRGVLPGGEVLAADVPVQPEVAAQLQALFARNCVTVPRRCQERFKRGLEVAVLGDAAFEGPDLAGALDAVADLAGELRIAAGVPQLDVTRLAGALEVLARVLADRLQHPEPVALAVRLHESLVDERLQLVEDRLAGVGADGLDVRECAPSGEDGHAPEHALFRLRKERVAPVDRRAQRLLPLGNVAKAGRQYLKGVVETVEQRLWRQEPESGGRELESERQAVQAPTDRCDGPGVPGRQLERASGRPRALDEQRDRRIRDERLGRARIGRRGKLERFEPVLPFGGDPQRCPARGHDPQPGAALDQAGQLRSGPHDLLEVVQEQERLLVTDQCGDAVAERPPLSLLHVKRRRESGEKLRGIVDVGQRDERDTVQELGSEQPAELDDDPRLSDTAGTRDRDDPMFPRQLHERRQIGGTAEQRRGRVGEVARRTGEPLALALQRCWIRHDDAVGRDRVELERAPDVLEPEPPQAYDVDVAPALDLVVRAVGQHHSAGHRERLDPGGDVHRVAGEPFGLDDYIAHVDADANRNFVPGQLLLDRDCGQRR
jgi:hypothetical protein